MSIWSRLSELELKVDTLFRDSKKGWRRELDIQRDKALTKMLLDHLGLETKFVDAHYKLVKKENK